MKKLLVSMVLLSLSDVLYTSSFRRSMNLLQKSGVKILCDCTSPEKLTRLNCYQIEKLSLGDKAYKDLLLALKLQLCLVKDTGEASQGSVGMLEHAITNKQENLVNYLLNEHFDYNKIHTKEAFKIVHQLTCRDLAKSI